MSKLKIRKECIPYAVVLSVIIILLLYFCAWASIPFILLLFFVIFFFRDPERAVPDDDSLILSPADGVIMDIRDVEDDYFTDKKAIKVTIFLSLFNVHINRSPIRGKVVNKAYRPGKYLPAYKSHASELNERNTIYIENEKSKVIVHQITGLVARRIVCWSKKGDMLKQGERFGIIKFGSCTEILVPRSTEIKMHKGDTVRGGLSVIGVIK